MKGVERGEKVLGTAEGAFKKLQGGRVIMMRDLNKSVEDMTRDVVTGVYGVPGTN